VPPTPYTYNKSQNIRKWPLKYPQMSPIICKQAHLLELIFSVALCHSELIHDCRRARV